MTIPTSDAPPVRCSVAWDRPDLPAWGTAARAGFWLALEQPGPWGNKAPTQSHLDPGLGADLDAWCANRGGRLALIRRPGQHADRHGTGRRQVLLATDLADGGRLTAASIADPAELLDLLGDWQPGTPHPSFLTDHEGVLLVCTNGRRDQCCALDGRPLAHELGARFPGRVWESSHLGGHRFAPTAVALPGGQTFARLDATLGAAALTAQATGELVVTTGQFDRGRSHLSPIGQVLDAWARQYWDEPDPTAITVNETSGVVRHRDGRRADLRLSQADLADQAPESCGKSAVPLTAWQVEQLS